MTAIAARPAARVGAGIGVAVTGWVMLTLCEVVAFVIAESAAVTTQTSVLGAAFGVSTVLIGLGSLLAGIAVIRERRWTDWARYVVLASGVAVFVLVIPGLLMSFAAGRVVLIIWMLIWAALGVALIRGGRYPPTMRSREPFGVPDEAVLQPISSGLIDQQPEQR